MWCCLCLYRHVPISNVPVPFIAGAMLCTCFHSFAICAQDIATVRLEIAQRHMPGTRAGLLQGYTNQQYTIASRSTTRHTIFLPQCPSGFGMSAQSWQHVALNVVIVLINSLYQNSQQLLDNVGWLNTRNNGSGCLMQSPANLPPDFFVRGWISYATGIQGNCSSEAQPSQEQDGTPSSVTVTG